MEDNTKEEKKDISQKEKIEQQHHDLLNSINMINMMRFAKAQKIQLLDPNGTDKTTNSYKKYTRADILSYLKDPRKNNTKLIEASNYLYASSTIYQRVVRYLSDMLTFDYVITPYQMKEYNTKNAAIKKYSKAYYETISELENMDIKHTFNKIMQVVVREGAFYGLEISNADSYMIYQLPYNKCKVTWWEDGCPVFSLDMSYFDDNQILLESIGGTLKKAYNTYKQNKRLKWQEIDSSSSVCILFDESLNYVLPPLSGAFTDIYLVEDYKDLMKSKEIINLTKLINLKYPTNKETGALLMDEGIARAYYNQIANQLDETIAVALNPFEMEDVSFDTNKSDSDGTLKAQRDMFSNLGISNLVFSNEKASSTALKYSLADDMTYVLPVLRACERWFNKKLKTKNGAIKFQLKFLDISIYNRDDFADKLNKSLQYGLPVRSMIAASHGLTPAQTIGLSYIENEIIDMNTIFKVPQSANTQSNESGRPTNEDTGQPLSESGESHIENT